MSALRDTMTAISLTAPAIAVAYVRMRGRGPERPSET